MSHFMSDFIEGKVKPSAQEEVLIKQEREFERLEFSDEAKGVFAAGREIYRYYHTREFNEEKYNPNIALYEIRELFQGRNEKGKMNPPSKTKDEHYKTLIGELNVALKVLAKKIEKKIYEYGFLRD